MELTLTGIKEKFKGLFSTDDEANNYINLQGKKKKFEAMVQHEDYAFYKSMLEEWLERVRQNNTGLSQKTVDQWDWTRKKLRYETEIAVLSKIIEDPTFIMESAVEWEGQLEEAKRERDNQK